MLAYYNCMEFVVQAPLGDEILFLLFQNFRQHFVALLKAGNGIHNLMVSCVASGFIQLHSQISQLLGMGSVVIYHILHQRHQLLHGGVLALAGAAVAMTLAAVAVVMGVTLAVKMLVVMGMGVFMLIMRT